MKKTILAIVGLPGAGKTEVTEYLIEKTGWPKIYFGDVTFERMEKDGLEITEANERVIREKIRKELGMGAYAILNIPKIKGLFKNSNVILESFYSWEEYLEVKKEFSDSFKVLAILASPEIREVRMLNRPKRPLTKEEFHSRDYAQIENLHQAGPIARADFFIVNQGSKEELFSQVDEVIKKVS